ncbi:MAG: YafY family protein [Pseudomonadota bacterium]
MRRAERLFEIVQILRRAKTPISAESIAEELEISKRSVYRDMSALIAQRVPIRGEAGVGYVLEDGFDMPPLMLTDEEIDAAVLGALWVASRAEPDLAKAANNLLSKIEAVAPNRLKPQILHPATSVAPPKPQTPDLIDPALLRRAIRKGHKVMLRYRDTDGAETERTVWPVVLGYREEGRILAAWCELREGFRYFRTDQMITAEVLDARFPERPERLRGKWRKAMDEERLQYEAAAEKSK